MLICFQLVRLARKTLCDLEGNLNSSAWLQVTPELCSSFYFCISFRSSPRSPHHPCTPVPVFLQHLSNMFNASEVLMHAVPTTILSHTCSSIPASRRNWVSGSSRNFLKLTASKGEADIESQLAWPKHREAESLFWPSHLAPGSSHLQHQGHTAPYPESFPDLALMSLLSFRYSDSL